MQKDSIERRRILEWVHFYKISPLKYNCNALISVYRNDGEKMLYAVLKELSLTESVDLIKDAAKNDE